MKQLTLFEVRDREDIPSDVSAERYGKGKQKARLIQYDEDDPAYVTPGLKVDSAIAESIFKTPNVRVDTYIPKGTARGDNNREYYRLIYKRGRKWHHRHICGGAVGASASEARKEEIQDAIAKGTPIEKLLEMRK